MSATGNSSVRLSPGDPGVPTSDTVSKKCAACDNDGWVEVFDDDGALVGAKDCPYLSRPFHAPFNDSALIPEVER